MKKCPVCHAVTRENNECHVCQSTITYEPPFPAEREKLPLNRYTALYLLRELWFPVLCILIVLAAILYRLPIDPLQKTVTQTSSDGTSVQTTVLCSNEPYLFISLLFAVFSFLAAFFHRQLAAWTEWKYNREYSAVNAALIKYCFGIAAVFIALLIALFSQ